MSLLQGSPLPSIRTTKEVKTTGPDWYDQYLQKLAAPGTAAVAKTGEELVAPMTDLQRAALNLAPTALTSYGAMLEDAGMTAEEAAKGITPEMISGYMSPYLRGFTDETGKVRPGILDEMSRLSQQNLQRNLMPTLRGAFAGTGGYGSSRMMGALGQMGADVQANLLGAQTKAIQDAYNEAVRTAGTQSGLLRQAAETQRGLASTELEAAIKALEEGYGLGTKEQQFEQAKIMAPLTAAGTAANVFANLKVPSTVAEEAFGPIPGAYSTSPLAQVAGLGSLFASGKDGTSPVEGFMKFIKGIPGFSGSSAYGTSDRDTSGVLPDVAYQGTDYADSGETDSGGGYVADAGDYWADWSEE